MEICQRSSYITSPLLKGFIILVFLIFYAMYTPLMGSRTDSLYLASIEQKDLSKRLHAMALLAGELIPAHMDSARVLLEKSSQLAAMVKNPVERAAWLNLSGNYNWFSGNHDSAMVNYKITYAIDHPDVLERRAAAAINIGALYNRKGIADSIRHYLNEAIRMFDLLGDEKGHSRANYSLGIFYSNRGNYELALRHYLVSLNHQLAEKDTFALIYSYNALGNLYGRMKDRTETALEYFHKGIELNRAHPVAPMLASLYSNISFIYLSRLKDYDKAIEYARLGIESKMPNEPAGNLFGLYINAAEAYRLKGNLPMAREFLDKAMELESLSIQAINLADARLSYGDYFKDVKDYQQARLHYSSALERGIAIGSLQTQQSAYQRLFLLDSLQGNYLGAIDNYQKSRMMHDSIWEMDRANRLSELEFIYELDKKAAENALLRQTNELNQQVISKQRLLVITGFSLSVLFALFLFSLYKMNRKINEKKRMLEDLANELIKKQFELAQVNEKLDNQNHELIALNQTKDKFFSVIAHDLRGPFNSLLGFLDVLTTDFNDLTDEKTHGILLELPGTSCFLPGFSFSGSPPNGKAE